ncbi:MAG: hypothetical protein J0H98_06090 [Solirubrobacterales bacterium]|nr:hypothetical protein [Solirubrobacterales bacterium]
MNADIKTFRRFVLALLSVLFLGLAAGSLAQGKVKLEQMTYRVQLDGLYVHDWHEQSENYPAGNRVWSKTRGNITSGFTTNRGILFRGARFTGDFPKGFEDPGFQFYPLRGTIAKTTNRQNVTDKHNYVPACGGELGECDGTEPSGVKTVKKQCRKQGRLPFELEYDDEKPGSTLFLRYGFSQSNHDFCGKSNPFFDSVDQMRDGHFRRGLELISKLKKGQRQVWRGSREFGEIRDETTGWQPVKTDRCPALAGTGFRKCWTIETRVTVTRIK